MVRGGIMNDFGPPLNFLVHLSSDWESFHRPDMLRALARRARRAGGIVLCIDRLMCPITGPLRGFRNRLSGPSRGLTKWRRMIFRCITGRRLEQVDEHLYLLRAFVFLDDRFAHCARFLLPLNRAFLRRQVAGALSRLHVDPRSLVSWYHFPLSVHYVGMFGERLRVYECYDEHSAIAGLSANRAAMLTRLERELFRRVDLVFTTSQRLLESKRAYHERIHCVPNAADVDFYARVMDRSVHADETLTGAPRPIVGYLGTIHEHTDLELIRTVAEQRPQWTVVLVGKVDQRGVLASRDFLALHQLPNVRLMGWVDRDRLLSVCKTFDVCLIPYRSDAEFNKFVNPNKLHEYTAMGKPIVAMEGVEVDSHRDMIWTARDAAGFLAAIEEAYRGETPEKIAARIERARANSWDVRIDAMMARVLECIEDS